VILPDTSAWVEYLRRGEAGRAAGLDRRVERREVATCGPVVAELLAGTAERDRGKLARALDGLPWIELGRPEWHRAGELAASLRGAGMSVPLTDIEIAVAALAAEATVWTADADFRRIAQVADELLVEDL
jgi:predicted nucleic acid-binding protein